MYVCTFVIGALWIGSCVCMYLLFSLSLVTTYDKQDCLNVYIIYRMIQIYIQEEVNII